MSRMVMGSTTDPRAGFAIGTDLRYPGGAAAAAAAAAAGSRGVPGSIRASTHPGDPLAVVPGVVASRGMQVQPGGAGTRIQVGNAIPSFLFFYLLPLSVFFISSTYLNCHYHALTSLCFERASLASMKSVELIFPNPILLSSLAPYLKKRKTVTARG